MRCHVVAEVVILASALVAAAGCTTGSSVASAPSKSPAAVRPRPASGTTYTLPPVASPVVVHGSGARSSPPAATPSGTVATSSFETAVAAARRDQKLAVVDFGAPWCGPCKTMQRTTWSDPSLLSWLSRNATRAHVDIDQRTDLSQRYDIGAVPTTIVLRDGQEVGRFTGSRGAAEVQAWLQGFARSTPPARQQAAAPPPPAARPATASSMTRVTVTR